MLTTTPAALMRLFFGGLLLGLVFGLCYDVLRVTRVLMGVRYLTSRHAVARTLPMPPFPHRTVSRHRGRLLGFAVGVEDFLFCLVGGAATAIYLSAANQGRVRWLAFAGIAVGFAAYYFTLGRLVIFFSESVAALLRFCFCWVLWGLWLPLRGLGRCFRWFFAMAWQKINRLFLPSASRRVQRRCLRRLASAFSECEEERA